MNYSIFLTRKFINVCFFCVCWKPHMIWFRWFDEVERNLGDWVYLRESTSIQFGFGWSMSKKPQMENPFCLLANGEKTSFSGVTHRLDAAILYLLFKKWKIIGNHEEYFDIFRRIFFSTQWICLSYASWWPFCFKIQVIIKLHSRRCAVIISAILLLSHDFSFTLTHSQLCAF